MAKMTKKNNPGLNGKNILVGVTGGISAYKACEVVRMLVKEGANVNVVMTNNAEKFVSKMTFKYLSGNKVLSDMYDDDTSQISHIELADSSDLILICPATANFISKFSGGIADNLLLNILLATKSPIVVCPAMNVNMYNNSIIKGNVTKLKKLGTTIVEPASGELACGWEGKGRLAELETIVEALKKKVKNKDLADEKILLTCGATREYLDPIRFISNPSSGRMGLCLANELSSRGAITKIISGYVEEDFSNFNNNVSCQSCDEMAKEVLSNLGKYSVIIKAAAVGDYKFKNKRKNKLKKTQDTVNFEMDKNIDILGEVGKKKKKNQILIGFCAETENVIKNAKQKIKNKNLDLIVANDVSVNDSGFGEKNNFTYIVDNNNKVQRLGLISKEDLSIEIGNNIDKIRTRLKKASPKN
ncbi:MAG: bifunctional phosphopantothenoylcysteine decarboxylase/phosphopantothenate--cysteine ligase CoaBC [Thermodesulfobacteriota bacterium]|jgi:phosphopantothenoylcysteine decarboxylase/phosphopantothenate--cysteine ligase|nr:MAG: bifunctional phosphopantothenoylcysteine decarboxylase/phosphopantothenate--cysteine ligase CoaBC [Candidatus Dadabacteria bacterium]